MDVGSAARLLLRRWWVILIGLLLTLGSTAYLYTQSPTNYQAQAQMILLLPPNSRPTEGPTSPFLYLPNGLQVLAGMVIAQPNTREYRQSIAAAGLTSQYELDVTIGSPIVTLSVEGTNPQNVIATRDRIIKGVRDELARIQREEKTPAQQTAKARLYGTEATPDVVQGNRTRGLLVALGVGGLITLLATFAVDRLIALVRNRRARASARAATGDAGDAAADPGAEGGPDRVESGSAEPSAADQPGQEAEEGEPAGTGPSKLARR